MFKYKLAVKLIERHLPVEIAEWGSESIYYDTNSKIMVIGKYFDPNDYGFMRHLGSVHKFVDADKYSYTLWHLLHEIGHFKTEEKYGNNLAVRQYFKENAKLMLRNTHLQNSFHNLRVEWEATEWAINWVKEHPKKAKILNLLVR